MSHSIGWVDDEIVCVTWCNDTRLNTDSFTVNIYKYAECPICHKKLKLRQHNFFVDEDGNEVP